MSYRVCQGLRLTKREDTLSRFWPLLQQISFFEAAGAVAKNVSSLKPNHNNKFKPS